MMYPKAKPFRSARMRTSARGQLCQVGIVGVCNGNPATVVLAHAPHDESKGMGLKPDDVGAWACSACHDELDARTSVVGFSRAERMAHFYKGAYRTTVQMFKQGLISA